jgi:hypothetical protein
MHDTTPQAAEGKVLWHFTMSLDGFVAGPTDLRPPHRSTRRTRADPNRSSALQLDVALRPSLPQAEGAPC